MVRVNGFIVALLVLFSPFSQAEVVRFGFPHFPPFAMMQNGKCVGIYCDYIKELFEEKLGYEVDYQEHPWVRVQKMVERGDLDVMLAIPSAPRKAYALSSNLPVFYSTMRVYTRADHPRREVINQITTVTDIREGKFISVTNRGNGWHEDKVEAVGVRTVTAQTEAGILRMLAAGRGDLSVDATRSMRLLIKQLELEDVIVETPVVIERIPIYLLVGKASPLASDFERINQEVWTIEDET